MKIFIGSSTEYEHVAHKIARIVEDCGHTPIKWREWFEPSDFTLSRILELPNVVDGGIFILSPDDKLCSENESDYVIRDNVLIEAGVLFGSLGSQNVALCKIVSDANHFKMTMPSDWSGVTYIKYDQNREVKLVDDVKTWLNKIENISTEKNSILFQERNDFEKYISSAKEEIMMSSFFMSILQTSRALQNAIDAGIKIRFLITDYWGENLMATVTMLDGLGADEERVKMKLKTTLQYIAIQMKKGGVPNNLEIRFIDYVFPTRLTIIDPDSEQGSMDVHISSYINRTAKKVSFNITKQNSKFNIYKEEYEKLWKDARPINIEEINALFD